ncbi:MAG: hypothetical protein ACKVZ0_20055 [Gemmatimonadales bacterium]
MMVRKIAPTLLIVTGLAACSDGFGPGGDPIRRVSFTVSTSAPGAAPGFAAADSIVRGGHTLVLSKVELVLRSIKLHRVERSTDCSDDDDDSNSGSSSASSATSSDDDYCEKFVAGPMLLDLPLGADVRRLVTVEVDTGTYRRLEFKIHKPEDDGDDAEDTQFLRDHPDLDRISTRVTGTYDGRTFVYISDLNAKQRTDLVPPLVVGARANTDLTLVVDVRKWFVDRAGALIDPQSGLKGQRNDDLVRDNIRRSFRFFQGNNNDDD